MPSVITANRLQDGAVVYLSANDNWITELASARVAEDNDQLDLLQKIAAEAAARHLIVGAYPMDVDLTTGAPAAKSVREKIRAARRPTIAAVNEAR